MNNYKIQLQWKLAITGSLSFGCSLKFSFINVVFSLYVKECSQGRNNCSVSPYLGLPSRRTQRQKRASRIPRVARSSSSPSIRFRLVPSPLLNQLVAEIHARLTFHLMRNYCCYATSNQVQNSSQRYTIKARPTRLVDVISRAKIRSVKKVEVSYNQRATRKSKYTPYQTNQIFQLGN